MEQDVVPHWRLHEVILTKPYNLSLCQGKTLCKPFTLLLFVFGVVQYCPLCWLNQHPSWTNVVSTKTALICNCYSLVKMLRTQWLFANHHKGYKAQYWGPVVSFVVSNTEDFDNRVKSNFFLEVKIKAMIIWTLKDSHQGHVVWKSLYFSLT